MQHGRLKVGIAAAGTLAVAFTLAAQPAFADYAPAAKDVVGVGSDTVQYASDFIADGDYTGDGGYNTLGNKFKVVNFDATPDANARLAYGPGGDSAVRADLGTGGTEGTGNQPGTHTETGVCTLNPTIVLRGGQFPIQRPTDRPLGRTPSSLTRASTTPGPRRPRARPWTLGQMVHSTASRSVRTTSRCLLLPTPTRSRSLRTSSTRSTAARLLRGTRSSVVAAPTGSSR